MSIYSNNASGNSRVGMQIGYVGGDISENRGLLAGDPDNDRAPDLSDHLDRLEMLVTELRDTGQIDGDAAELASEDVTSARNVLPVRGDKDARRFTAHLRRIGGAITASAAVTTAVAEAVSAVQELL
ncbi:hypothetical protein [Pseudonocardia spirodelae]|uniref:Uncharacterized protein n=1 Tax=Pseudonocardia spirodelae TaxID=3133431 RepID=A0ABU8T939_9PSEU